MTRTHTAGIPVRPYSFDIVAAAEQADMTTDYGRASLVLNMMRSQGLDVAWTPGLGFAVFDGTVWNLGAGDMLVAQFHAAGNRLRNGAVSVYEGVRSDDVKTVEEAQAKAAWLVKCSRSFHRTAPVQATMATLSQVVPKVTADEWDADRDSLLTLSGLVDLRTGDVRPPTRDDRMTQRLAVEYDPTAQAPTWLRVLSDVLVTDDGVTPDKELIAWFQRLIGYGTTGHTSEQIFAVLHGSGSNGKGVLVDTLSDVFDPITQTASFETFASARGRDGGAPSPDLARLAGARLVFASEGEAGVPLAEGLVKRLTGQDMMTARHLQQEPFEYRPRFLLSLVTNHLPTVRGNDDGIWRRVRVIPFRRTFAPHERDRDLREKLLAERTGILAWAVEGARLWYAAGKRLDDPMSVTARTDDYRESQDRLADFVADCLDVTGDPADNVSASALFAAYNEWCDDERETSRFGRNNLGHAWKTAPK